MKPSIVIFGVVCALAAPALANPRVTVTPTTVHRGDAVLVTVANTADAPSGTANGDTLQFFRGRTGYQALVAVPLEGTTDTVVIDVKGTTAITLPVRATNFPETDIIVEDELANPDAPARKQIDEDNAAIIAALAKGRGEPQFTAAFRRPPGEVTSKFGEWRTFNDGHKSQHLGLDLFSKEGTPVKAINAGTVVLVRDTFLAGQVVVVAHGGGIASAYYHLSGTAVAEGDKVDRGTVIGNAGHTGRTTGPHLHLSVRTAGGFVDPVGFFKLKISPPRAIVSVR